MLLQFVNIAKQTEKVVMFFPKMYLFIDEKNVGSLRLHFEEIFIKNTWNKYLMETQVYINIKI